MMPATEKEFIRDYIERTKLNYERLKAGPYEVTQLINSAIGLLIIPEQKLYDKITNKMISKQLLNELIVHIQINTYDKQPNLKIIARHLRNGKRCGFSKRYFLVLVACRHLTCTKTECRKMFLSLIAPLTTIRLNRGKRSNRLPYIFAQGQER